VNVLVIGICVENRCPYFNNLSSWSQTRRNISSSRVASLVVQYFRDYILAHQVSELLLLLLLFNSHSIHITSFVLIALLLTFIRFKPVLLLILKIILRLLDCLFLIDPTFETLETKVTSGRIGNQISDTTVLGDYLSSQALS
jgi:hypothetical protein